MVGKIETTGGDPGFRDVGEVGCEGSQILRRTVQGRKDDLRGILIVWDDSSRP